MDNKLERLKALAKKADAIATYEIERKRNLKRLEALYAELELAQKGGPFEGIFDYSAINLTGVSLQPENLGETFARRYVQMIAIAPYEDRGRRRSRNFNLRYFGRSESLDPTLKDKIVEFILRWRLEKSFRGVDHYRKMLQKLDESF